MAEPGGLEVGEDAGRENVDSTFTADALRIVGGTFIIQVLVFLASPIVTRLYGPESYGIFALFLSITTILGALACLQYDDSIMLPETLDEAASLFNLSVVIALIFSMASIPVLALASPTIAQLLNVPQIEQYLPLLSLSILLYGVLLACTTWNSRQKKFGSLSVAKVGGSTTNTVMQLSAGYAGYATGGSLIIASIVGPLVTNLIMGFRIWKRDKALLMRNFSRARLKAGLMRYKNFPIFDTWAILIFVLSWQLPAILFAAFFSPDLVGYYALGMTAVGIPSELIGASVSQVFFQRASVARKTGELPEVVGSVVTRLFAISFLPFLMLIIIGPYLFGTFFGQNWTTAGTYAGILAPWMLMVFITSPLTALTSALEKQRASLTMGALFFPIRMGTLIVGCTMGDPEIALLMFSLVSAGTYFLTLCVLLRWSGVHYGDVVSDIRVPFAYSVPPLLVVAATVTFLDPGALPILAISVGLMLCYYVLLLRRDSLLKGQVVGIVSGVGARFKKRSANR